MLSCFFNKVVWLFNTGVQLIGGYFAMLGSMVYITKFIVLIILGTLYFLILRKNSEVGEKIKKTMCFDLYSEKTQKYVLIPTFGAFALSWIIIGIVGILHILM